jgi:hypothetical protein
MQCCRPAEAGAGGVGEGGVLVLSVRIVFEGSTGECSVFGVWAARAGGDLRDVCNGFYPVCMVPVLTSLPA